MKKILLSIIGCIVLLGGIFLYAHVSKPAYIYDRSVDTSNYKSAGMYLHTDVKQTFCCTKDHLDAVRVKCAYTGPTGEVDIRYRLLDETGNVLRENEVDGVTIGTGKTYDFGFETVENCKDQRFTFELEEIGADTGKYIDFSYLEPAAEGTSLTIDGEAVDGTLIIRPVTAGFDLETFVVLTLFVAYIIFFFRLLYKLFS